MAETNLEYQPQIVIIVGSTRQGRRGRAVADWLLTRVREVHPEVAWQLADLAEWHLPWLEDAVPPSVKDSEDPTVKAWAELIRQADGFVWVSAEYNHGYPAPLKNAIDLLYHPWVRKPVAMVSYGGGAGGSRAAEQLRQVAVELQMVPTRFGVVLPGIWQAIDEHGVPKDPMVMKSVDALADDLIWWARALHTARLAQAVDG